MYDVALLSLKNVLHPVEPVTSLFFSIIKRFLVGLLIFQNIFNAYQVSLVAMLFGSSLISTCAFIASLAATKIHE